MVFLECLSWILVRQSLHVPARSKRKEAPCVSSCEITSEGPLLRRRSSSMSCFISSYSEAYELMDSQPSCAYTDPSQKGSQPKEFDISKLQKLNLFHFTICCVRIGEKIKYRVWSSHPHEWKFTYLQYF